MSTKPPKTQSLTASARKVFSREGVGSSYPTYTNNVDFGGMGMEIFMDVGMVNPESVQAAMQASTKESPGLPVVDFNVFQRFAMSLQTAIQMQEKLTTLIQATKNTVNEKIKEQSETKN